MTDCANCRRQRKAMRFALMGFATPQDEVLVAIFWKRYREMMQRLERREEQNDD